MAVAQDFVGNLEIIIVDAATQKPLSGHVLIGGPVDAAGQTDGRGVAIFSDLPEGLYTLKALVVGYKSISAPGFRIYGKQVASIRLSLVRDSVPKLIGSVVVRSLPAPLTSELDTSSGEGLLNTSLLQSLAITPGIGLDTNESTNGTVTLRLNGHPGSDTGVDIDGIPMTAPGVAADLRAIGTDIFKSGTVSFSPTPGSLGGTVNFHTLEPTLDWQAHGTLQDGSYNQSFSSLALQGTSGIVGVAVQHVERGTPDLRYGNDFLDTSGFSYAHDDAVESTGDLFKLRSTIKTNSLSATFLDSDSYGAVDCPFDTTIAPCGYAPVSLANRRYQFEALSDSLTVGTSLLQFSAYSFDGSVYTDLTNRTINYLPSPLYESSASRTVGWSALFQTQPSPANSVELAIGQNSTVASAYSSLDFVAGSVSNNIGASNVNISASHKFNGNTAVATHFGDLAYAPGGSSAIGGFSLTTRDGWQAWALTLDQGAGLTEDGSLSGLSDPGSNEYDCASKTVNGSAPGDPTTRESAMTESLSWQYNAGGTHASAAIYQQSQHDGALALPVPASALPISSNYVGAVGSVYSLPLICGVTPNITANNIYLSTVVSGLDLSYSGARVQASTQLIGRLEISGSAAYTRATVNSNDPRVTNPYSLVRPGAQLPGVPFVQGRMIFHLRSNSERGIESILGVTYLGDNNSSNLPPFATIDLAFGTLVGPGRLSLIANNVTNAYPGTTISNRFAVPSSTLGAGPIIGIAVPNLPRRVSLNYSFAVGRSAVPTSLSDTSGGVDVGPHNGLLFSALPRIPPKDPFEENAGQACSDALRRRADTANRLVRRIEDVLAIDFRESGAYPSVLPDLGSIPGFDILYFPGDRTYSIGLRTTRLSPMNALIRCLHIHIGTPDAARDMKLYAPSTINVAEQKLYFSPDVGYYLIPIDPGPDFLQRFRTYALPVSPPADPFRISSPDLCKPDVRPDAERLLGLLRSYFAVDDPATGKTGPWIIEREEVTKGKPFYLLTADETVAVTALLSCAVVAAAPDDVIMSLGFDAAPLPSFNYSKSLGLYIIKP